VHSHLDETMLTSIAQATGGAYRPLGADGRGLDQLYALLQAKLPRQTTAGAQHKVYAERYQLPLAAAIACLLVSFAIGDRRRRGTARLGGLGALLVVLAVPAMASADAPKPLVDGVNAYTKHDFTAAQKQFESALHTADVARQHDAYYDLGDARYRVGQATEQKDKAATIATWKQALAAYDAAIGLAPMDGHARFNRTFVAIKIAQLEQQQKQQKQQQNQQDQQKKDQKGGGGQQAKNQQGQKGQKGQKGKSNDQQAKNGSGEQPKDQKGQNGQQPKDQQGQSGQPKHQQGQNGQPKDQQANNGTGQQPKDQQGSGAPPPAQAPDAADRAKPASSGAVGTASPTDAKQAADARAEAAADAKRREAGQLTHDEAVQLLNSVEDELHPMPIHSGSGAPPRQTPTKDW
jgi:hypothetical protein